MIKGLPMMRRLLLLGLLSLTGAGCGFSPALAPSDADAAQGRAAVSYTVADPGNAAEFRFARALRAHLPGDGRTGPRLGYTVAIGEAGTTDTRINVVGRVDFVAERPGGGAPLRGSVQNFVSYSDFDNLTTAHSVERSKEDAYERLSEVLAQMVWHRLLALEAQVKAKPGL